jgi:hypothetical protein
MKRTLIRYKAKPERAEENEGLIKNVFTELQATSPQGIRYLVLRLEDGSFVHLVVGETEEGSGPLTRLEAFQAFSAGVAGRCLERPEAREAVIVGDYRMLA